jgi:hypothetical protein
MARRTQFHRSTATQSKAFWAVVFVLSCFVFSIIAMFFSFFGWFGLAVILTAAVWIWTCRKHPASSAADALSGNVCSYCGAQLPNSGVCPYCGGRSHDES